MVGEGGFYPPMPWTPILVIYLLHPPHLGAKHFLHILYLLNDHLYILIVEPHSPRKPSARTSQTSLAAAVIGQSFLGS